MVYNLDLISPITQCHSFSHIAPHISRKSRNDPFKFLLLTAHLSDVREIRLHHFFIRLNINNNERLFDLCYPEVTLCISIQTYLRLNSLNDHKSKIQE